MICKLTIATSYIIVGVGVLCVSVNKYFTVEANKICRPAACRLGYLCIPWASKRGHEPIRSLTWGGCRFPTGGKRHPPPTIFSDLNCFLMFFIWAYLHPLTFVYNRWFGGGEGTEGWTFGLVCTRSQIFRMKCIKCYFTCVQTNWIAFYISRSCKLVRE